MREYEVWYGSELLDTVEAESAESALADPMVDPETMDWPSDVTRVTLRAVSVDDPNDTAEQTWQIRKRYKIYCDGVYDCTVTADSAEDALDNPDADPILMANWPTHEGPVLVRVKAVNVDDENDSDEREWLLPMDEPNCDGGYSHTWVAPHLVVGGLAENPGVQLHGGGVSCVERCPRCGGVKVADTWDQSIDGVPRKTVRYEAGDVEDFRRDVEANGEPVGCWLIQTYGDNDEVVLAIDSAGYLRTYDSFSEAERDALREEEEYMDWEEPEED